MTKRLVDIDDSLLDAARQASGQATIKATVNDALERLVAEQRRTEAELTARWEQLGDVLQDLHDEDVMREAWR